jgi:8-oxo-dGTP pyrophosphatase MutT (NUDIX family)
LDPYPIFLCDTPFTVPSVRLGPFLKEKLNLGHKYGDVMFRKYKIIGTLAFFVSIPGLFFYLKRDERSRVIVQVDDKILVLKGWYGSNRWMLPGGGMHKGERPVDAAVRELAEETGIELAPEDLTAAGTGKVKDSYGLGYTYHLFTVELPERPETGINNYEIHDSDWRSPEELMADKKGVLKATRAVLYTWLHS